MLKATNRVFAIGAAMILLGTVMSIHFGTLTAVWNDNTDSARLRNSSIFKTTAAPQNERKILLWNTMFGDEYFYFGKTGHFDKCPKYQNCRLMRSRESLTDYDAILFHENEMDHGDLPMKRDPRQNYVFVNLESPINRPIIDSLLDQGYFNMTMTYRLDSDIPWPYRILRNIETGKMVAPLRRVAWMQPQFEFPQDHREKELASRVEKKTKMAAWLVSNCRTWGKRELYVNELKKYMDVDVIGSCADSAAVKCDKSRDCFAEEIEINYFFYLSFENSLCEDYVTEKFLNALRYDVIPVVYGGANYSLFAPPHSYIDVLDFENPEALANFLTKLSRDRKEYMKYFWWKRFYSVDWAGSWTLCKLCETLNEPRSPKSYSPLRNWFMKDKCPIQDVLQHTEFATKSLKSRVLNKSTS